MDLLKKIENARNFMLWIVAAALAIGICYAIYTDRETKTPDEIMFEKTHTR